MTEEIVEGEASEANLVKMFEPIPLPFDRLTKIYLKIRGAERELTQQYETKLAELEEQKKSVANALKEYMRGEGVTSMKTDFGTVSLKTTTRYWTSDWEAFEKFCLEQGTIGFLEKRVAQKNMADFIKDNPDKTPLGLNAESEYVISVRKPT